MSLGTANRDGGKTSESGHLRPLSKIFGGNILGNLDTSLKVVQRAAGANMSVDVGIGDAMLYRSDGTYGHPVFNDAAYNQVISAADGSNPRRDIVVIYVDYGETPSTGVSNNTNGVVKIKVVNGTPAGSPSDPSSAAIQSSVGSGNPWAYLARVRVGAGVTTLANAVIDDLRQPTQPRFLTPVYSDIINSGCIVAQRVTAPNLSTTYQYGAVDRIAAKGTGTAVSAGTISQITNAGIGASGYALRLAGVTITGSGKVFARYRMEAKDAIRYKNQPASFAVKVQHDVGSACNYVITVRKPSAADNFASVSDIANSGNISVASGTPTLISFENINSGNLGDVSNGLEIEIEITTGAITTKNFDFTEFQLNRGVVANPYVARSFEQELAMCQRYYEKSKSYAVAPTATDGLTNGGGMTASQFMEVWVSASGTAGTRGWAMKPFKVSKHHTATMRYWDGAGNLSKHSVGDVNMGAVYTNQAETFRQVLGIGDYGIMMQAAPAGNWWNLISWDADAEL